MSALKAFSSKRGLFFTVKGPRTLPKFRAEPPPPAPPHKKGLLKIPVEGLLKKEGGGKGPGGGGGGAGGGVAVWNLGSARGPFTANKRPLFDENAFLLSFGVPVFGGFPLGNPTKQAIASKPSQGKKKAYTALLQCRTSLAEKMGSTDERFRWWIWFSWVLQGFCIHHRPGSFSLRPEKFSKRFSFGCGCVRFVLLCSKEISLC